MGVNMAERVAVELCRKELNALIEFWLGQARAYEKAGNKVEAGKAFERSQRIADLRHEID